MKRVNPAVVIALTAAALLAACSSSGGSDGPGPTHALTVTKAGTGSGTVSSSAGGLDCGATCAVDVGSGTVVTLTAVPATGSTFTGWSGGACSGVSPCTLTMTADRTVTATFGPARYPLTVTKMGNGNGTVTSGTDIDCGFVCGGVYAHGTAMTLTATASSGSTFTGWTGACTGTSTCVVDLTEARSVVAGFDADSASPQPSAGCGKTRTLANGTNTVQSNGARTYILKTPDGYDNTHPYRLVLAYHWRYGDAQTVASQSYYGLSALAGDSTIFVAPMGLNENGMGNGWQNADDKDVAFTDALLAQVEADLCIDTSRVFATGWSWGSAMSYALACERGDKLRGIALYSLGTANGSEITAHTTCSQPVAYWAAHGVSDDVLSITGGHTLRDVFVTDNGCTAQTPTEPAVGSRTHLCTAYQGCSPGHPVTWCAFDGGHMWNPTDSGQPGTWVPSQVWSFITQF